MGKDLRRGGIWGGNGKVGEGQGRIYELEVTGCWVGENL